MKVKKINCCAATVFARKRKRVAAPKLKKIEGYDRPLEVWELPKISPTKQRRFRYGTKSWEHPARMDLVLCRKILKTYTKEGELILDPMAGIFSTGIEGAILGRNIVGIELEEKFVLAAERNIELLQKLRTLAPKGNAWIIQADSTKLSKVLSTKASSIVFSPPYGKEQCASKYKDRGEYFKRVGKRVAKYVRSKTYREPANIANMKYGKIDTIVSSPPYSESLSKRRKGYTKFKNLSRTRHMGDGTSDENIANLRHGKIEKIIFSPPYADSKKGTANPNNFAKRMEKFGSDGGNRHTPGRLRGTIAMNGGYSENKDNLGNLPYGAVDTICFSPPYSECVQKTDGKQGRGKYHGLDLSQGLNRVKDDYSSPQNLGNIGNFKHGNIDAILSSPPYSEGIGHAQGKEIHKRDGKYDWRRKLGEKYYCQWNKKNIARLKHDKGKRTYLSEMLKVYRECFKVLKLGGKMVLVVKNFIRNKKIVRLDLDTIKLCEATGFQFQEAKLFKLPTKSFWRNLYAKKHPEVDNTLTDYEFVLVFEKPANLRGEAND